MALMHCCCICCSVRAGAITVGILQVLSLIAGAGIVGALLAGLQMLDDTDIIEQVLNDYFEIDPSVLPNFENSLQDFQEAILKQTEAIKTFCYVALGYIALDFILTCMMIHGARTSSRNIMVPWICLNGLRACATLASGIYLVIQKTELGQNAVDSINTIINDLPNPNGDVVPTADPDIIEQALASVGIALIVGSMLSLYFVLVVVSQFQIIKENLDNMSKLATRISVINNNINNGHQQQQGFGGMQAYPQQQQQQTPDVLMAGSRPVSVVPMTQMQPYYAYENQGYAPNAPPPSALPMYTPAHHYQADEQQPAAAAGKRTSLANLYPNVARNSQWVQKGFSEPYPDYD